MKVFKLYKPAATAPAATTEPAPTVIDEPAPTKERHEDPAPRIDHWATRKVVRFPWQSD